MCWGGEGGEGRAEGGNYNGKASRMFEKEKITDIWMAPLLELKSKVRILRIKIFGSGIEISPHLHFRWRVSGPRTCPDYR